MNIDYLNQFQFYSLLLWRGARGGHNLAVNRVKYNWGKG